jgi:hypothetical protein
MLMEVWGERAEEANDPVMGWVNIVTTPGFISLTPKRENFYQYQLNHRLLQGNKTSKFLYL